MRKITQKIPTSSIILFIIGAFLIIWGAYQNIPKGNKNEVFNAAVLTKSDQNQDVSGSAVVTGTPEILEKPVDPLTGVTADGMLLIRTVEMYQYVIENDEVYKQFSASQEKNIKGKNGENYKNPAFPDDLHSAVFGGKVSVDGTILGTGCFFALTEDTDCLEKEHELKYCTELPAFENDMGLLPRDDGTYSDSVKGDRSVGDIRIHYTYLPVTEGDIYTFYGTAENGILGETDGVCVFDRDLTSEEIYEKVFKTRDDTATALFFFGGILLACGAAVLVISVIKNKKEGGNI